MVKDRKTAVPDEAHLADIAYHKRQNRFVLYMSMPSMLFYAGFYGFYLSNIFQACIFILMFVNALAGLLVSYHLKNIRSLTLHKRVTAGIAFVLLATNLLTGLWDPEIYYVVLPWIFLYPVAAVMFFGRKLGFLTATAFTLFALVFFLINEMPMLDPVNIKLFAFNALAVLISILVLSVIYEKTRMRIQDDLAVSQNEYRLAELRQRETNIELTQEIHRRELSEKALAESELHYRALFEESTVALWEEDWSEVKSYLETLPETAKDNPAAYVRQHLPDAAFLADRIRTTALNRAALTLFQIDRSALVPANLFSIMHPDNTDDLIEQIDVLMKAGTYRHECVLNQDGTRPLHLSVNSSIPAGYENNWGKVYSSIYDMTQRIEMEQQKKRMDEKLQNARQIQAIATLAGGIAHQFNNALAVIYGSLDLLEIQAGQNQESRRFLVSLKTSATRMSHLTDQLLAYAEGGKYQPQEFSVNDLIGDLTGVKNTPQGPGAKVSVRLDETAPLISGDVTQIRMVFEAVLANALEALGREQGGVTITTGTQIITRQEPEAGYSIEPGTYVLIRIEDEGSGMDKETLNRIFEPFFTTKIHGRGLGMAAAFGIVRNHDGFITVESEPGKGTTVAIYLPASRCRQQSEFCAQ